MTKQKFKDLLWTVYFTDEMEKSFPTPMVKGMAFSAMVYLWEAKELEVCGRTLTRDEIRYILFEKLSPCEFQYAIERFVKLYRAKGYELLGYLIIDEALSGEAIGTMMAEYDLAQEEKFNVKGGAA